MTSRETEFRIKVYQLHDTLAGYVHNTHGQLYTAQGAGSYWASAQTFTIYYQRYYL